MQMDRETLGNNGAAKKIPQPKRMLFMRVTFYALLLTSLFIASTGANFTRSHQSAEHARVARFAYSISEDEGKLVAGVPNELLIVDASRQASVPCHFTVKNTSETRLHYKIENIILDADVDTAGFSVTIPEPEFELAPAETKLVTISYNDYYWGPQPKVATISCSLVFTVEQVD